jgi:biotin synthesis protein BioG
MQYKWLNRNNNKKLIVFFNGWGMNEKIVSNLAFEDFDVLTFFDYRTFEMPDFDFSIYEKKYLIAWSMGVYVCNVFYDKLKNFDRFLAINGTQNPIDDNFGIPVLAYNMTIDNFNELTCKKFMKKISSVVDLSEFNTRSLAELKQELISIRDLKAKQYLSFNKAIISNKDRIFPYKNMVNFWQEKKVQIIEKDGYHYLFDQYKNWGDLL